jgi:hypothetical protein
MALKGKKSQEETFAKSKDFQGFLDEFQEENDRSAAIIGAAFLDEHLKQLLANFMVDNPNEVKELLSSESPLGSFGARIHTCGVQSMATSQTIVSADGNHKAVIETSAANYFFYRQSAPGSRPIER